jgi:hypothetical protein
MWYRARMATIPRALGSRGVRAIAALALVLAGAETVPRAVCGREAGALFDGDLSAEDALAREVAAYVAPGAAPPSFKTGSPRFDGEWALVTYQMAALGLGQVALAHPERRDAYLPAIEACVDRLLAPESTAFGAEAWGERGLAHLESEAGHAYLGYVNLALGVLRLLRPDNRFAAAHDALTVALSRRLAAAPHGVIETYPGEAYPADVAAVAGSIGLHGRATGADPRALLDRWSRVFRAQTIDPRSGLLFQSVDAGTGAPADAPRASGTAIAAYFLSFADPALSRDLFLPLAGAQRASFLGFGGVREYAPGHAGRGDIDSGPVLLDVSVSATGFALSGARLHGDRALFAELYRTADLFGAPLDRGAGRRFVTGGPLGNAILLAMLTAGPGRS